MEGFKINREGREGREENNVSWVRRYFRWLKTTGN
jgi:hypothetical protein